MTVFHLRAPRSAVIALRMSRSFVAFGADEKRVDTKHSCTPERLHA